MSHGSAWQELAGQLKARQGSAKQGKACLHNAEQGRQGRARRTGQSRVRRGSARQSWEAQGKKEQNEA